MTVHLSVLGSIMLTAFFAMKNTRYNKEGMKTFVIISEAIIFFVIACRADTVGQDTPTYKTYYDLVLWNQNAVNYVNWEPLFMLLIRATAHFGGFQLLLAVCAAITCAGFGIFIYYNADDKWIAFWFFFFYITLNLYFNSMHLIRQICAMAISINTYTILKSDRSIKSILICAVMILLSMGFHITAFIFMVPVLFPLFYNRVGRKTIIMLVFATVMVGFLLPYAQSIMLRIPRLSRYANSRKLTEGQMGVYAFSVIILKIILTFFSFLLDPNNKKNKEIYQLTFINVIATMFFILQIRTQFALRIGYWYEMFFPYYIPKVVHRIRSQKTRMITFGLLFLYGLTYFLYMMTLGGGYSNRHTVPYLFFWQQ